jgi:hypothetical protein
MFKQKRSSQAVRDRVNADERMRLAGPRFVFMKERLKHMTKKELFQRAFELSNTKGSPKPDRLCHRCRIGMICWFCKYALDCDVPDPKVRGIVRQARWIRLPQRDVLVAAKASEASLPEVAAVGEEGMEWQWSDEGDYYGAEDE